MILAFYRRSQSVSVRILMRTAGSWATRTTPATTCAASKVGTAVIQSRSERSTGYREPLDCWRHWTRKSVAAQLVQAVTSGPLICPLPRHEAESAVMELVRSTAMRTPVHPSGLCVSAAPTPSRRLIKILKLVCICFVSCQATPRHGMPGVRTCQL